MPSASAWPLRSRRTAAMTSAASPAAPGRLERRRQVAAGQRSGGVRQPLELEGEEGRMGPGALQRLADRAVWNPSRSCHGAVPDPLPQRNICNWTRQRTLISA